jgi:sulfur-oxidizing protein SoxX
MTIKSLTGIALTALSLGAMLPAVQAQQPSNQEIQKLLLNSFKTRSIAKVERINQSELQQQCSAYATQPMPDAMKKSLEKKALDSVKYPADGRYLGDWKQGERIAQNGRGMQFSDNEKTVNGGNCYACHQLTKAELSYGNIGPTLYNYGKLRGNTEPILKYTWARIWNSHAFNACNIMPRYGDAGILTEDQIRNVMALLLDPASPVNQ